MPTIRTRRVSRGEAPCALGLRYLRVFGSGFRVRRGRLDTDLLGTTHTCSEDRFQARHHLLPAQAGLRVRCADAEGLDLGCSTGLCIQRGYLGDHGT